jgi:hypothetical protein
VDGPPQWIQSVTRKVLSLFSVKEVKTPLSLFFRVISAIVILGVVALFTLDPLYRYRMLIGASILLLVIIAVVTLLAWYRPKHLVYGETGHRAETRLSFGTEKQGFSESEMAAMPGMENPKALPSASGEAS